MDCAECVENEQGDIGDIACDEQRTLPALEFAKDECREQCHACDSQAEREVENSVLCRHRKRCAELSFGDERAEWQNERNVDDICTDDVADGEIALLLDDSGDCGDEFRK